QDDDRRRVEFDDVRIESDDELLARLPANAAIDVGLTREMLGELPGPGNRVAEEHYPSGLRRQGFETLVIGTLEAQHVPVLHLANEFLRLEQQATSWLGRVKFGNELTLRTCTGN